MLVFSISDFTRNNSKVLEAALTNEVIINNYDGKSYKLLPIKYSAASSGVFRSPEELDSGLIPNVPKEEPFDSRPKGRGLLNRACRRQAKVPLLIKPSPRKNNSKETGKSLLEDIPYITADITTQEIVELIRENRAGM